MDIRDKRLATLLAQEVIDNEDMWINYEQEETEVKIDLADMVLEHLVGEITDFISKKETCQNKSK